MARKKTAKSISAKKTPQRTRSADLTNRSGSEDVFDVDRVRQLVELMKEHDLSEVDLRQSDKRIKLRRGDDNPAPTYVQAPLAAAPASAPPPASSAQSSRSFSPAAEVDEKNIFIIRSPMVGTFYSKPKPEAETYVKVGDHVSAETTVCIIEAMKVFNEIPADCNGKIVAVLVDNEQPVDVDKPLFKVDTSA